MSVLTLPASRSEAKAIASLWYFTGKPCKHGHVCKRRTNGGKCQKCVRDRDAARSDYFKAWRVQNLDKCRSYTAAYRERNPGQGAEYMRRFRSDEARCENLRARERERYAQKKEHFAKKIRLYQKNNPEYFAVAARNRRALQKGADGSHTKADIDDLLKMQKCKCAYCRADCSKSYHVDHIKPLTLGGSNSKNNLQILCQTCNLKKSNKDPIGFASQIGLLL